MSVETQNRQTGTDDKDKVTHDRRDEVHRMDYGDECRSGMSTGNWRTHIRQFILLRRSSMYNRSRASTDESSLSSTWRRTAWSLAAYSSFCRCSDCHIVFFSTVLSEIEITVGYWTWIDYNVVDLLCRVTRHDKP